MRVFEELDVSGGVLGARVRDVREALVYYDREIEEQTYKNEIMSANDADAKCPFGFVGGQNPHEVPFPTVINKAPAKELDNAVRCPWPFVVFHDPATFMKDWQTWFLIGLVLCWCWSNFYGSA